jgi:hypothetical protein
VSDDSVDEFPLSSHDPNRGTANLGLPADGGYNQRWSFRLGGGSDSYGVTPWTAVIQPRNAIPHWELQVTPNVPSGGYGR